MQGAEVAIGVGFLLFRHFLVAVMADKNHHRAGLSLSYVKISEVVMLSDMQLLVSGWA